MADAPHGDEGSTRGMIDADAAASTSPSASAATAVVDPPATGAADDGAAGGEHEVLSSRAQQKEKPEEKKKKEEVQTQAEVRNSTFRHPSLPSSPPGPLVPTHGHEEISIVCRLRHSSSPLCRLWRCCAPAEREREGEQTCVCASRYVFVFLAAPHCCLSFSSSPLQLRCSQR